VNSSLRISTNSSTWLWAGLILASLLTGCGRDDVKTYRIAKEESSPPAPNQSPMDMGQMPAGHPDVAAAAQPKLTWKTPEGWSAAPPSEFRLASFKITGGDGKQADVSIVPLPGTAGGDFANVNRWRGQVGLQSVSEEELKKLAQPVEIAGQPGDLYEQIGKNPGSGEGMSILGVIQHREGTAWFFKMTGGDKLVEAQKPAFVEFLKSVKFEAQDMAVMPSSHPPMDGTALPSGHPDISAAPAAAGAPSTEGQPKWQVPAGWKEAPGGQFLVAKFIVAAGEGGAQAAVNVSMSAGDGGGLAANVNRWRKQLGLSELSSDEIVQSVKPIEAAGGKATIVEMSGTDARSGQPAQLVGAIVPYEGQTWFYKLMGDTKVVESQKEVFTKFVQSVKY
jgi:hypothetical protein